MTAARTTTGQSDLQTGASTAGISQSCSGLSNSAACVIGASVPMGVISVIEGLTGV